MLTDAQWAVSEPLVEISRPHAKVPSPHPAAHDRGDPLVHELPDGRGTQLTALNFGPTPIEDDLREDGALTITLEPYEGLSLRVVGALTTL